MRFLVLLALLLSLLSSLWARAELPGWSPQGVALCARVDDLGLQDGNRPDRLVLHTPADGAAPAPALVSSGCPQPNGVGNVYPMPVSEMRLLATGGLVPVTGWTERDLDGTRSGDSNTLILGLPQAPSILTISKTRRRLAGLPY